MIFRGNGLRMSKEVKSNWDKQVKVLFQEKARCDEIAMKYWINDDRGNIFMNTATPKASGKIL